MSKKSVEELIQLIKSSKRWVLDWDEQKALDAEIENRNLTTEEKHLIQEARAYEPEVVSNFSKPKIIDDSAKSTLPTGIVFIGIGLLGITVAAFLWNGIWLLGGIAIVVMGIFLIAKGVSQKTEFNSNNQTTNLSTADELKKFKQLRDEGIITEEEFVEQKKKLLS